MAGAAAEGPPRTKMHRGGDVSRAAVSQPRLGGQVMAPGVHGECINDVSLGLVGFPMKK